MSSVAQNSITGTGSASNNQSLTDFWNNFGKQNPANPAVTTEGKLVEKGMGGLVNWALLNPTNKTIGGFTSGSLMGAYKNYMDMGQDLTYRKAQLGQNLEYEKGMQQLSTGNTAILMGMEGNITKDLTKLAGNIGSRQIGEEGDQERRTARVLGDESRLSMMEEGSQNRMTLGAQGIQDRLGTKAKGKEDRLSRREQGLQDRLLTQTKGSEERKTQRDMFRGQRQMRADARGPIRGAGARFFR